MIEIKNINIRFDNKECIRNGYFIAYPYQITGIYGESGTGKSSLLYVVGMLSNQQYQYFYNDELLELNENEKALFRNEHISFITQSSLLIETISVEKNLEFYLEQSDVSYTANMLLEKVRMKDKAKSMPNSLSGGERQRVAIACAIAKNSDIILADELTSSLDDENKIIVMDLLRECANQGKIVILVSHEKNIIEESDRIYKLDHLELTLEKEVEAKEYKIEKRIKKKIKSLKIFEILFYSNKKNNRRRVIISFIVMAILFICTSIFVQSYKYSGEETYSADDISDRKILVLSDESGEYHNNLYGYAIREPEQFSPLTLDIKSLKNMDHIEQIYDYYIFPKNSYSTFATTNTMNLTAKRDGKEVSRRESSDEYWINSADYIFSVIPTFPQESTYNNEGVYINSWLAFYYNLEVGDTLELELNVPFAFAKSIGESKTSDEKETYNEFQCITERMSYQTKVVGIVEANCLYPQIYMNYDIMQSMIDEKIEKYKNGGIQISEGFDNYYTIQDLEPYAKAVFADKYENSLQLQNNISQISDKIYVYNEYQSVLELIDENNKIINNAHIMAAIGITIFLAGGVIIEIMYLKKYKSCYMMMNLIGYDKKSKYKVISIQSLWQMITVICSSMIVYVTASIPDILNGLNIMKYEDVLQYINNDYNIYMVYCSFSKFHFMILFILIIVVIIAVNIAIKKYYDKQDLIKWLREK